MLVVSQARHLSEDEFKKAGHGPKRVLRDVVGESELKLELLDDWNKQGTADELGHFLAWLKRFLKTGERSE